MDATANEHKKIILHCHGAAAIIGRRTGKVNTAVFMLMAEIKKPL